MLARLNSRTVRTLGRRIAWIGNQHLARMTTAIRVKLLAEKAPYLLTLFVAATGWLVSYTVGRFEKSPLLEYSTRLDGPQATEPAASAFTAAVRNISPSGQVACARVVFTARKAQGDAELKLTPGELLQVSGPRTDNVFREQGNLVLFQMDLHAGAAVELPMQVAAPARLTIAQAPCQSEEGQHTGAATPILMERSLTTWVIRNALAVLWVGLVFWAVLLCLLFLVSEPPAIASAHPWRRQERGAGPESTAPHRPPSTDTGGTCP